ncbi:MAG: hypothetical protein PHD76_14520 [Methylacidiphilales bacterium]|nr:hypothetical protein [Candidatus Methylacidiphilales bacterium]
MQSVNPVFKLSLQPTPAVVMKWGVLNKKEVLGYLIAAKGAGMMQVFALLTAITEINRFAWVRCACWSLVLVGLVLLFAGLGLASRHEAPAE